MSTSGEPHCKKRKLADALDDAYTGGAARAQSAVIRDEHIWFEDGTIIVRAGPGCTGAGAVYGFRCHGSVLAARSPVFKTMLQLPNDSGERLEGAHCVDLTDAWEDVRDLLRLLYDFFDLTIVNANASRHPNTLAFIAGPMRLAAKYEMDSVLEQLRPLLTRDWPDTFEDWLRTERAQGEYQWPELQDPAAVVQLAQQARVRSVLPGAYYDLARVYLHTAQFHSVAERFADARRLARDDLERVAAGRERIARHVGALPMLHMDEEYARCALAGAGVLCRKLVVGSGSPCVEGFRVWWRDSALEQMETLFRDPLAVLDAQGRELHGAFPPKRIDTICRACRIWYSCHFLKEAQELWEKLPEFFELSSLPF